MLEKTEEKTNFWEKRKLDVFSEVSNLLLAERGTVPKSPKTGFVSYWLLIELLLLRPPTFNVCWPTWTKSLHKNTFYQLKIWHLLAKHFKFPFVLFKCLCRTLNKTMVQDDAFSPIESDNLSYIWTTEIDEKVIESAVGGFGDCKQDNFVGPLTLMIGWAIGIWYQIPPSITRAELYWFGHIEDPATIGLFRRDNSSVFKAIKVTHTIQK